MDSSNTILNYMDFMLTAAQIDGYALKYASRELHRHRQGRESCSPQRKKHGTALEYASTELQADTEVVLAAVQTDGSEFMYASPY